MTSLAFTISVASLVVTIVICVRCCNHWKCCAQQEERGQADHGNGCYGCCNYWDFCARAVCQEQHGNARVAPHNWDPDLEIQLPNQHADWIVEEDAVIESEVVVTAKVVPPQIPHSRWN